MIEVEQIHQLEHPEEEPEMKDEKENRAIVLSVQVAFGIIITTLSMCGIGFGSSIWWASSISTKMDVLVKQNGEQVAALAIMASRITALEMWRAQVDATGTPAMQKRMEQTDRELQALKSQLDLHEATTKRP